MEASGDFNDVASVDMCRCLAVVSEIAARCLLFLSSSLPRPIIKMHNFLNFLRLCCVLLVNHLVKDLLDDLQIGVPRPPIAHCQPDSLLPPPRRTADIHLLRVVDPVRQRLLFRLLLRKQHNVQGHNVIAFLLVQELVIGVLVEVRGHLPRESTVALEDV